MFVRWTSDFAREAGIGQRVPSFLLILLFLLLIIILHLHRFPHSPRVFPLSIRICFLMMARKPVQVQVQEQDDDEDDEEEEEED